MSRFLDNMVSPLKLVFLICLGMYTIDIHAQDITDISIVVTFESDTANYTAQIAPLKYNKRFALSMQIDDGNSAIIDQGFPVFEGGTLDGDTYTGYRYSDGCGVSQSFKMSSAMFVFNSYDGSDAHTDPATDIITWSELNTLYANNWGIQNHGVNTSADLIPAFMDYSIARNTSYCRRKMYDAIPGGVITSVFVNPNGVGGWTQPALDLGSIGALNQNNEGPLGESGGNVNETGINWAANRYNLYRHDAGSISVRGFVDEMANLSVDGANYWGPILTHNFTSEQYAFADFVSDFDYINNTYGENGSDEILMTTDEEILDYLILRDGTVVSEDMVDNVLTITFSGNLPTDLLFYDLSLVLNSDVLITDITISGTNDFSISNVGIQYSLVNFGWDGKVIPSAESLATEYTTVATSTQTEYDALIAMDYVSVVEYGDFKASLVSELCGISGVEFDEGFCQSGYPDYVTITGDSVITLGGEAILTATEALSSYLWSTEATTRSITVSPDVDTKYWVTCETKYGESVNDTILVTVADTYITNNSPPEVLHTVGQPDSLWVVLADGTTPLWSTGETENYIIVDPIVSTTYTLSVLLGTETVQQMDFDVVVGNFLEFTYDSVCLGGITTLTNISLVSDTITEIFWDLNGDTQFDDAEGEIVEYTFETSGDHLVGMRVFFKNSPMDVIYNPVPVGDIPYVDFTYSNVCTGSTTYFDDLSTATVGEVDHWLWRFGDGKTDNNPKTTNTYESPGIYDVLLTVQTSLGCKDSLQKTLEIVDTPTIELKTESGVVIPYDSTVYFSQGGTTTITISNFETYDSVIWFDDSRAVSITIAEEGDFGVYAYKNGCEGDQGFKTSWSGSPEPSGDDIMNLFTPNGDGYNDYWVVNDPLIISPFKVNVFNRSGKQVYANDNYQSNWDGQYNGNPLPQATYYYIIEDSSGSTFKGPVTIIR